MELKLGKKPARPEAVKFKLSSFVDFSKLPKPPAKFGHENLVADYQMLGNDKYGDCVWASAAHDTMLWNAAAGKKVEFTDKSVLSDYSAVTGFDPSKPDTDQGTDMKEAAAYRRTTGILDAHGNRHKIDAYLSITPGNLLELYAGMYLFEAVDIGILFPSSAMDQFNAGKAWSVVSKSPTEGGHCISLVAKRKYIECITWGKVQPLTTGFFSKYCDEVICYVSKEMLTNNKSPEGFDAEGLIKCLNELK